MRPRIINFQLNAYSGADGRIAIWIEDHEGAIFLPISSKLDFIAFSILLTSGECSFDGESDIQLMKQNL